MTHRLALVAMVAAAALALGSPAATRTTAPYSQIVSVRLDGSDLRDLTAGVGDGDFAATQARDGRIAFIRTVRLEFPELRVMGAEGGESRALARVGNETSVPPQWSPDGRRIAFQTWDESACSPGLRNCALAQVSVVDVDTGRVRTVGRGAFSWSPDGRLAHAVDKALLTVRPDGTGRRVLFRFRSGTIGDVAWSPRGDRIALLRDGWIWLQRSSGGAPTRVARATSYVRWGPHGRTLLYRVGRSLRLFDTATRRFRELGRVGEEPMPAWSRDGRSIVYRISHGTTTTLYVVRAADGRRLHTTRVSGNATSISFTPDGTRLVYARSAS